MCRRAALRLPLLWNLGVSQPSSRKSLTATHLEVTRIVFKHYLYANSCLTLARAPRKTPPRPSLSDHVWTALAGVG